MVKIGAVWDRTAEFLADNLSSIMPVALFAFFFPYSINGSFQQAAQGATESLQLVFLLVSFAVGVLSMWGALALIAMVTGDDSREAGRRATRRLLPAVIVRLALLVPLCLCFLPTLIALVAGGADFRALLNNDAAGMPKAAQWTFLVNLLVVLPLWLALAARLVLIDPVVLAEERMFGAIARSWRLTRGLTWRMIGVILLYLVVSVVAWQAARTVFGVLFQLIVGDGGGGLSLSGVLTSITVAAVQAALAVVSALFAAHLLLAAIVSERGQPR
ncbi:hypothetical protein ACFQ1E_08305 [Sphingomonas canadensis]|uniref:Glycerophosphoryl diester phosphodiesterase membrane domain-containing protein n=1 Tax=Sphingomonas canadensis TaxID=1219257 RepID=A0ABW3H7F8_9SPHN|nr:hypothetical protein [Sphingomonas canadensis]MCW3836039.1 hypothetical protein [Sphingomonas canadensis]